MKKNKAIWLNIENLSFKGHLLKKTSLVHFHMLSFQLLYRMQIRKNNIGQDQRILLYTSNQFHYLLHKSSSLFPCIGHLDSCCSLTHSETTEKNGIR
jgi:hypothetical protein